MKIMSIFAASNHKCGTKAAKHSGVPPIKGRTSTLPKMIEATAPRGVSDNDPEASALMSLTARSAVFLLSNVKS